VKDFVVITPARNEEENLSGLMKSLESQNILPDNLIWIIVVNGCTDNTLITANDLDPKFKKIVLEYNSMSIDASVLKEFSLFFTDV
jgi:glycosyltransferase involved in cell wall biosynthesis